MADRCRLVYTRNRQQPTGGCEKIDRDPATLETSVLVMAVIDENMTSDMIPEDFRQQAIVGGPEQVADQIKAKVLDVGISGVILSPITNLDGYHPGLVTAVAEKLKPMMTTLCRSVAVAPGWLIAAPRVRKPTQYNP